MCNEKMRKWNILWGTILCVLGGFKMAAYLEKAGMDPLMENFS